MAKRIILHGISEEDAYEIQWDIDHGNGIFFHAFASENWKFDDITIEDEPPTENANPV